MNKKIVFLIRNVAPGDYGGGEKYQIELARVLKNNNFVPIIYTASERLIEESKRNDIEYVKAPFFRWQNWSGWRNVLLPIYYAWQIRLKYWYKHQIKIHNPYVLNIQSRDELIGATLAGLSQKKKIIWTDHADFRTWSLVNVDKKIKNQIGKWILRCARKVNSIIMINDYEKECLERLIRPRVLNNIVVIKNGIMDEYKKTRSTKNKKNSFYFVGRIVKDKGIFELLEAFKRVLKEFPDAQLDVFGDGEELNSCKKMLSEDERVKYFGYVKDPLLMASKDEVFVLPSYHEGLSLALLEAAMMGKRIIATNIEGNKEIIDGKNGVLVPIKDSDSLAKAMIWMIKNRESSEKMAKKVRLTFEEEFDLQKIFEQKMSPLYNNKEEQ